MSLSTRLQSTPAVHHEKILNIRWPPTRNDEFLLFLLFPQLYYHEFPSISRLYLANPSEPETLNHFLDPDCISQNGDPKIQTTKNSVTISAYVARTQQPLRLSKDELDSRFPDRIKEEVSVDGVYVM